MSDVDDTDASDEAARDERERIRERKRRRLRERLEGGDARDGTAGSDANGGGDAGVTEAPTEPVDVSGPEALQTLVDDHDVVLVDCYADWCGPCQMMEPTVEALASETDAVVAKVDVDANQGLAQQLGARGVPTFVLYADGQPVDRFVGAQDRTTLEGAITNAAA
ncbi:thioredoxin family protein [Halorubrum sp. SY-15]|jgi:thioredoxin 1|uniref:thioredoxin family protein n=1 Tax=Halorubrum sp. SY-15 TaxID=3402277 RepID=UPI003EC02F6A